MKQFYQQLALLKDKKIAVIGDIMLDEHIWCNVSRISPEAPVPVAKIEKTTHVPGGAANVARNIVDMGGDAYLVGLVGDDISANTLRKVLHKSGVNTKYLLTDSSRPTITKSRIIAHNQQVVRVDKEDTKAIKNELREQIFTTLEQKIEQFDGFILSDYNKGLLTDELVIRFIKITKKYNKIISVDPKGNNYKKYKNASLITPNKKEASEAIGKQLISHQQIIDEGKNLQKRLNLDNLLITRSEEGMTLFSSENIHHIHTVAKEVYDVSGAGDTVIAAMTLGLSAGLEPKFAAELANIAAGIVVAKIGTASVSIEELKEAIINFNRIEKPWTRKIIKTKNLQKSLIELKNKHKRIVSTNGVFDILHVGHSRYLAEAKQLGDILIVALNSDASVKRLKGDSRPINTLEDRLEILANLEVVDFVVSFEEDTPIEILKLIKPDIHVKGGDYKAKDLSETKIIKENGGKVQVLPFVKGKSSTNLIEKAKGVV